MPSDTRKLGPDDRNWITHVSGRLLYPTLALACGIAVFHDHGPLFILAAILVGGCAVFLMGMSGTHQWDVCGYCTQPPRRYATPEARARSARFVHAKWIPHVMRILMLATVLHILLPKPYAHVWWGRLGAWLLIFTTTALGTLTGLRTAVHNDHYRDDCHLERCRAGSPRRHLPFAAWLGHYGIWVLTVLVPGTLTLGILSLHKPRHGFYALYGGLLPVLAYGAASLLLVMTALDMTVYHTTTPCVRCAANPPTNGGEDAERLSFMLRLFHATCFWLPLVAGGIWLASWLLPGTGTGRAMFGLAASLLLPWGVLSRVHGRLRPWCPWCRKGGGGDHTHEDAPDPTHNQPVPV